METYGPHPLTRDEKEEAADWADTHWKLRQHARICPEQYTAKELRALGLTIYPDHDDRPNWSK